MISPQLPRAFWSQLLLVVWLPSLALATSSSTAPTFPASAGDAPYRAGDAPSRVGRPLAAAVADGQEAGQGDAERLGALVERALDVEVPTRAEAEYRAAVAEYGAILEELEAIDAEALGLDDQVDLELLEAHVRTRLFEYDEVELFKVHPVSYFVLGRTNFLFIRPGAVAAVEDFEAWLEEVLLPRSDRSPAWRPDEIEHYQFVHEQLTDYGVDEMLRIAEAERDRVRAEMEELADRIHPSGDLRTVWEVMKDEAPPWETVLPMAQSFVEMASNWLHHEGRHVVTIPDYIDYGARISPPMARRTLSFGGATRGPTVAGRQSGYYILTPLEDRLTPEEAASRIRSYNPYWTHVISYHEWLGHNVQIAAAREHVDRPVRRAFNGIYFSQAWSFYLEKLLEDEGYYEDRLDHLTALKTRMARRQMRMWRIQRILTKLKMARGEMSFDEAVQAYVDEIGMEPTNALIEVQRDSQTPSPPGREIIGERVILELRDEYRRRMGEHYTLKRFNDTLLTYGDLPFRQIRRLMFRD